MTSSTIYYTLFLTFVTLSSIQALQFNSTGYFTIVQFTDLHYGGTATEQTETLELQKKILEWVKPDLAVVSGDAASVPGKVGAGWYKSQWDLWTKPFPDANVPYAYTLGNHDDEGDLNKIHIVQLDETNPMSLRGTAEGIPNTTNFYVSVYSSRNDSELAAVMWSFDSGTVSCDGVPGGYGCIERDAIEWYEQESQNIREEHGRNVHHLAFFHIPIPEYLEVYNNLSFYGEYNEYVWCPTVNTGFFVAVKRNGDISAMFVGHDHVNDFGGVYDDVELIYGRKSGYHAYGDKRGAKVIVLQENFDEQGRLKVTRSHYILEENGDITYPEPLRNRNGPRQDVCLPLGSDATSIFENVERNMLVFLLACLYAIFV